MSAVKKLVMKRLTPWFGDMIGKNQLDSDHIMTRAVQERIPEGDAFYGMMDLPGVKSGLNW